MADGPTAADDLHARVIAPVARELEDQAPELGRDLVERFRQELPELYRDDQALESARASTIASVRAVAVLMRDDLDPAQTELPPETVATARDGARQGLPIAALLRTYRIGHAALWDEIVPRLASHAADTDELTVAIEHCASKLFGYVDMALMLGEEVYASERERFARSAAAVRGETIDALLSGRLTDIAKAGQRLRYDLARTHIGIWAWLARGPESGDAYTVLEAAVSELAQAAQATPLMQPRGTYAVAGWISPPTGVVAERLAEIRLPTSSFPGVRLTIGEPAEGLEGFRATHAQATSARQVASLAGRPVGSVTRYSAVALQALACADLEQARMFVGRELGALVADDDTTLRLAATLRVYLDEHASRSRAAKRLGVHENTISYRVKQVEEILGRSVEDDTLNLRVALALAATVRERR